MLYLDGGLFYRRESAGGWPKVENRIFTSPNLVVPPESLFINYYYGYDGGYYPRPVIRSYPYRLEYPPGSRTLQPKERFFMPREFQRFHYYYPVSDGRQDLLAK
jgi:hypothetical protein